jgi:uncharacterized protein YycO
VFGQLLCVLGFVRQASQQEVKNDNGQINNVPAQLGASLNCSLPTQAMVIWVIETCSFLQVNTIS